MNMIKNGFGRPELIISLLRGHEIDHKGEREYVLNIN